MQLPGQKPAGGAGRGGAGGGKHSYAGIRYSLQSVYAC